MSKKKFTEGLESLFAEPSEELIQMDQSMLSASPSASRKPSQLKPKEKPRKSNSKNFEEDLHSFLQDAFKESLEEKIPGSSPLPPDLEIKKRTKKPADGIDSLIRNTIEPEKIVFKGKSIKQVVVTFDEEKLKKLKKIARLEKKYLRKVINDIVDEFIHDYDSRRKES